MIERVIKRKVEEARNQGWKQRVLARFLDTSFRIARACGLTDINSALLETPTTKEDSLWGAQIERLINLGFHAELGMSEDNYRASIPAFNPQPERFRGRFAIPVLVDPRVSLQRQLELSRTVVDPDVAQANLTKLSLAENSKPYVPQKPYQVWIRAFTEDFRRVSKTGMIPSRSNRDFAFDERGLTVIEGIALLREFPNLLYTNKSFGGDSSVPAGTIPLFDSFIDRDKVLALEPIGMSPISSMSTRLTVVSAIAHHSYNLVSCGKNS